MKYRKFHVWFATYPEAIPGTWARCTMPEDFDAYAEEFGDEFKREAFLVIEHSAYEALQARVDDLEARNKKVWRVANVDIGDKEIEMIDMRAYRELEAQVETLKKSTVSKDFCEAVLDERDTLKADLLNAHEMLGVKVKEWAQSFVERDKLRADLVIATEALGQITFGLGNSAGLINVNNFTIAGQALALLENGPVAPGQE